MKCTILLHSTHEKQVTYKICFFILNDQINLKVILRRIHNEKLKNSLKKTRKKQLFSGHSLWDGTIMLPLQTICHNNMIEKYTHTRPAHLDKWSRTAQNVTTSFIFWCVGLPFHWTISASWKGVGGTCCMGNNFSISTYPCFAPWRGNYSLSNPSVTP